MPDGTKDATAAVRGIGIAAPEAVRVSATATRNMTRVTCSRRISTCPVARIGNWSASAAAPTSSTGPSRVLATVGAFRVVSESDVHDQLTRAVSGRWAAADATDGAVPRAAGGAAREGGGGSHLAMRGAPIKAIQELAGYRELGVTQRYMHLSPAALDSAIRLLDQSPSVKSFGDILETVVGVEGKING